MITTRVFLNEDSFVDSLVLVTRVTGIIRAILMMGALIPFNINTMSCYSFSGMLARMGDYGHPGYQMDDIICLIRQARAK